MKISRYNVAALLLLAVLPAGLWAGARAPRSAGAESAALFSLSIACPPGDQTTSSPASGQRYSFRSLTGDFLRDAGEIWSYPAHIKSGDLLPIALVAAAAGFLIANDEGIHEGFGDFRDNHAWVRHAGPAVTVMGSYGAWGTAGLFLGVGLLAKDGKSVETAVLAANAMLQSEILLTFIKGLTGRQRPEAAGGVDHWSGPVGFFKRFEKGQMGYYDSFPSGHTATAFSLATVVAMEYERTVWVPIVAYTVATGVGLSRVTLDKHWLSDVLVGGVIGHVIGRMVVRNHRRRYPVVPTVGLDHGSLSFAVTFIR
jgi:membrane-associated phospholipid phosphatase